MSIRLIECELLTYSDNITDEDRENGLLNANIFVWSDTETGIKVATVGIERWKNGWTSCYGLEVSPSFRGIGLGDDLVKTCKFFGVNHLSVDPDNDVAINLYKKHGFVFTGEKDGRLLRMELKGDV